MDLKSCPSLPYLFAAQAKRLGGRPFLWAKRQGDWRSLSWQNAALEVAHLAKALQALGVEAGDRVMLVSESRPEWFVADMAIMTIGAISVPAYVTNTHADHAHVLNDSGARLVIVSTPALTERVLRAALSARHNPKIIAIEPPDLDQNPGIDLIRWQDALDLGRTAGEHVFPELARTDTACLIYTSGTGGVPKGVMLSHGALLHNVDGARILLESLGLDDEVFLSFLPLSHSYEHTAGLLFPMAIGAQIYFCEGVEKLSDNMIEASPTIMTAVPRLYETLRGRILKGVERTGGFKQTLFMKALDLGSRAYEKPGSLSLLGRLINVLLERLVRDKVRARFGGRLKALVSGGAPLNYEVGLFFTALGLRILQGYGQTESAPVISCNTPLRSKLHTVGPPLAETEVRIAEDGEILVRGELVMQGYWNHPEATAQVLQGGWLHTGDIGRFDEDGYLQITDRKKDIIVNSGGDNISPQRIEGLLTLEPEIAQAMVHGDKRPHLVALIVPDEEFAKSWAQANQAPFSMEGLAENPAFHKAIREALDRVNKGLSNIEKVRRFLLVPESFTVANEMMTPTLKIRRHIIRKTWGDRLEALYE
ncbi:MAG: long-chain fatty acid--CoA ligase [Alphaproteobacteria bacterium]|nr:long-chain fatty acid--CoA ligase [Alphaproteobacteria bacterium]